MAAAYFEILGSSFQYICVIFAELLETRWRRAHFPQ